MTNQSNGRPRKKKSYNKPKPVERPEYFPFPTIEEARKFAVNAGFGVSSVEEHPILASRPDMGDRKFVLRTVQVDSTLEAGTKILAHAWFEAKGVK